MIKKSTILLFLIISISLPLFSQESNVVNGELIIQLKPQASREHFEDSFSQVGLKSSRHLAKRMKIWLFSYDTQKISAQDILLQIRQNRDVNKAQLNHYVEKRNGDQIMESFPSDPMFDQQWALNNTGQSGGTPDADVDAPEAWDIATGGTTIFGDTIVIAIVDGG